MNRAELIKQLTIDEGCKNTPYPDSEGILTIGVGHNLEAGPLSQTVIDMILSEDLDNVFIDLNRNFPWWGALPESYQQGLANMCFNMGINRLRGFKKMLAALERHDGATAADEALDSKWARQVGNRAARIADLYRSV